MAMWRPRGGSDYPYDLDGAERQVRFRTGVSPMPYPPIIGAISGFLPQLDWRIWGQMYGKNGSGPTWQPFPVNLQWQTMVPGLNKMNGNADS